MTCRTILLRDDPASNDEFGAHQRVADALMELFKNDPGGRAIGLEGAWGSGKSSIVDFVRKGLHSDGRFELVVFDAWAHEGDPLRRSFLEELSDRLKDRRWICSRRHEQLRRDLRERRPRLSLGAMLFGISALLAPTGVALLSQSTASYWWSLGLGLSFSPLLVLLGVLLVVWRTSGALTSLMGAVVPNASAASENMGATSIEFGEHFDGLLRAALLEEGTSVHPAPETHRLVIVIDNLDRVDGADARAIWRTLQTFVHRRPYPPFDRVWVLVPYDRNRIDEWSHLSPEDEGTDGFLSKSFAARFTVPPPVLSDWKHFLFRQLEEAMPDHNKSDWHAVYRAFDACRSTKGQEPTAREIKEFVNAVGTIHRQWGDRYPVAHVACFVLARDISIVPAVSEEGAPEDVEMSLPERLQIADDTLAPAWLMTSGLRENLAGLWFNREPSEAVEILLTTGIENAILAGDGEALQQIHENFEVAPSILEKVVDELEVEEAAQLLLVARAIVEAGLAGHFAGA